MLSAATLTRQVDRLQKEVGQWRAKANPNPILEEIRKDPSTTMRRAGLEPDQHQTALMKSSADRVLTVTTRQWGKSTVVAAIALRTALLDRKALVLLLSPSERQSGELMAKVFDYYDALGPTVAVRKRTELQLHLVNGSRIIALPENERTIRGYSGARLLVVDEASRVSDSLYAAVRPMLAVSRGRLIGLTTPFGQRGWFYEAWASNERWERVRVTADQCPRISPEFLAEERRSLGERWYDQEYGCSFEAAIGSVFSGDVIQRLFSHNYPLIDLEADE